MRTSRRIAILGATVASAMSLGFLLPPAPSSAASAGQQGLRPVSNVLAPVDSGRPEWVGIQWTTDRRVCHVRVRVQGGRDFDVAYPSDRGYTSFSKGDELRPGRIDSTSFRVTAKNADGPERAFRTATVDYDYCRPDSPTLNDAIGFWLPVRA